MMLERSMKPRPNWISRSSSTVFGPVVNCFVARLFRFREPDPEVETERRRDLVVEVRADALAGNATNHLSDQPSVGGRVVSVARAGFPMGDLLRQRVDDRIPRERFLQGHLGV